MFHNILFLCSVAVFVSFGFLRSFAAENVTNKEYMATNNTLDKIKEFFYNCTCIPYHLCSEANKYAFAARTGILPDKLYCSDHTFYCCKNKTEITTTVEPIVTVTPSDATITTTTTPATILPKETFRIDECGFARTAVSVRILTPDTESASTISGEIPWMVEIFQKRKNSKGPHQFKCAGSLIHPKVVLTVTHYVVSNKKEELKVVATGLENFQNVGINPDSERNVAKIIKHPKYYSGGLYNDIALLILENEYNFTDGLLNSICLPNANQTFPGKRCIGAGWGENKNHESIPLKKVDLPTIESSKCQDLLRKARSDEEFELHTSFTCAGGEAGKDTCKGDGGGPLMCLNDQYQFVIAGIVSWGVHTDKCGIADQPGVYTDVGKFRKWIDEQLANNGITL